MSRLLPKNDYQNLTRLYKEIGDREMGIITKPRYQRWKTITMILFFFLASASAAAWLGLAYFKPMQTDGNKNVELIIEAPEEAFATGIVTYKVAVDNVLDSSINSVAVRLNYPEGFIWQSASLTPDSPSKNTWEFAEIRAGEKKQIEITGMLLGEEGSVRTIFGVATYSLSNFRSELESSVSAVTKLTQPPLKITWENSQETFAGGRSTYTIKYEYSGVVALPPSTLSVAAPSDFDIVSSDPVFTNQANYEWSIPALSKDQSGSVSFTGEWKVSARGSESLEAHLKIKSDTNAYYPVAKGVLTTEVSEGDLVSSISANGQTTPAPVNLGDTINYELQYQNTSDSVVKNISIRVQYDSALVNWEAFTLPAGATLDGSSLLWTYEKNTSLSELAAGAKASLTWSVPLKSTLPDNNTPLSILATPELTYSGVSDDTSPRSHKSASMTISINAPTNNAESEEPASQ